MKQYHFLLIVGLFLLVILAVMDPVLLQRLVTLPLGLSYLSVMVMGIAYVIKTLCYKKYLAPNSWPKALGIGLIGTVVFTGCGMLALLYEICIDNVCAHISFYNIYQIARFSLIFAAPAFLLSSLVELVFLKVLFDYSFKQLSKPLFFGNGLILLAVPLIKIIYFWFLPGAYIPFIDPIDDALSN